MNPKKKVIEDFEASKTVPTQELASAYVEETKAEAKPLTSRLVAYAAFEHDGEHYEAGEEFSPRKTWKRDAAFEEFRSIELKKGGTVGIAFMVPGEIIDKKTQERAYNRIILPLTLAPARSAGEEV